MFGQGVAQLSISMKRYLSERAGGGGCSDRKTSISRECRRWKRQRRAVELSVVGAFGMLERHCGYFCRCFISQGFYWVRVRCD